MTRETEEVTHGQTDTHTDAQMPQILIRVRLGEIRVLATLELPSKTGSRERT